MERLNIFIPFSDSWAPYAGVAISSILDNASSACTLHFYILCQDITDVNKERFKQVFANYGRSDDFDFLFLKESDVRLVHTICGDICLSRHYSEAGYYRLFVADLLPADQDWALYLDSDILVKGDISTIMQTNLSQDYAMYAMPDLFRLFSYNQLRIFPGEHSYVNTGVMLVNLNYWRKNHVREKCLEYMKQNENSVFFDQDALNACLVNNIGLLHPKYNYFSIYYDANTISNSVPFWLHDQIYEAQKNPVIIHYAYFPRPWFKDDGAAFTDEWWSYLSSSPWKGMVKMCYREGGLIRHYWFWVKNLRKNLAKLSPFFAFLFKKK